jgi:hypothetical protein
MPANPQAVMPALPLLGRLVDPMAEDKKDGRCSASAASKSSTYNGRMCN